MVLLLVNLLDKLNFIVVECLPIIAKISSRSMPILVGVLLPIVLLLLTMSVVLLELVWMFSWTIVSVVGVLVVWLLLLVSSVVVVLLLVSPSIALLRRTVMTGMVFGLVASIGMPTRLILYFILVLSCAVFMMLPFSKSLSTNTFEVSLRRWLSQPPIRQQEVVSYVFDLTALPGLPSFASYCFSLSLGWIHTSPCQFPILHFLGTGRLLKELWSSSYGHVCHRPDRPNVLGHSN